MTYKVTRGPHCDADATITVPELNFTSYFLRKVSWIIGKSFLAVSMFVLIFSALLFPLCGSLLLHSYFRGLCAFV